MLEKGPTLGSIETSDSTVSVFYYERFVRIQFVSILTHSYVSFSVSKMSSVFLIFIFPHQLCRPQKRQLASQSLAFNIKDEVFCELFPDVVEVSTAS